MSDELVSVSAFGLPVAVSAGYSKYETADTKRQIVLNENIRHWSLLLSDEEILQCYDSAQTEYKHVRDKQIKLPITKKHCIEKAESFLYLKDEDLAMKSYARWCIVAVDASGFLSEEDELKLKSAYRIVHNIRNKDFV